ncbi:MAG: glutamyl-tRNA synthetase [Actinomycetota bacterium]|nr:glutamyl-tRNA synthetase [Actinomycetota bacterium]
MSDGVRVRFAPSPTGYLHVGNARTFLYNWCFARQQDGHIILRIEDTDAERHIEDAVEVIRDGLRWLGIEWDEEARQSHRRDLHTAAAQRLVDAGHTYWCGCTRDEIDARAKERGGPPGYDGHCRDLGLPPGEGRALRFRVPDGVTVVPDIVRGSPSFENRTIEDFVVQRSDGSPLFLLANVVDDGDMHITHVIRGDDHLPNTPKYLLLWDALGYGEHPVFAHLPMMVNEKRQKLSKRRDKVAVSDFRDEGYLPEVLANSLALVGWGPPDGRERMTLTEMRDSFRLEDVSSSPGFFDVKKLRAFNGDAIRALPVDEFIAGVEPFAARLPWADRFDVGLFRSVAPLVQERVEVLADAAPMVDFLFLDEPDFDETSWAKTMGDENAGAVLDAVATAWEPIDWVAGQIGEVTLAAGDALGVSRKRSQAPVRVAITGRTVGPPLWESLEVLGRERALARLRAARARL